MNKKIFTKVGAIFMAAAMLLSIFAGAKGAPDTVYAADTYKVIVNNGTGSGDYAECANVEITADSAPDGKYFKEWKVIKGEITLGSTTDTTTSFEMPASDVEITVSVFSF